MKTIIHNDSKLSKYIFEDSVSITMEADKIITPNFIIGDLSASNSTMIESVEPPEDWSGNKYTFENDTWTLNPDWVDPAAEPVQ